MKNIMKKFGAALMAGILCGMFLSGCSSEKTAASQESSVSEETDALEMSSDSGVYQQEFANISVGEFTMQDINGEAYTQEIFQDYDLTLVNIFATWCSPCVAEIPDLEKLRQTMADQENKVNVIGIVLDGLDAEGEIDQESIEKAKLLAEKTGAAYPFLVPDTSYMNGHLAGIEVIPQTFFVDKNGYIVGKTYIGRKSLEDWEAVVTEELENIREGE